METKEAIQSLLETTSITERKEGKYPGFYPSLLQSPANNSHQPNISGSQRRKEPGKCHCVLHPAQQEEANRQMTSPCLKEEEMSICQMPQINMMRTWKCLLHLATRKRWVTWTSAVGREQCQKGLTELSSREKGKEQLQALIMGGEGGWKEGNGWRVEGEVRLARTLKTGEITAYLNADENVQERSKNG